MVPLPEDADDNRPSETTQQPGDRLRQEQRKELASLDQQAGADTEMDEKVRLHYIPCLRNRAMFSVLKCLVT